MSINKVYMESPLGKIVISGGDAGITGLDFTEDISDALPEDSLDVHPLVIECLRQLKEYFNGRLKNFNIKLAPKGTPFQESVWKELLKVPYGTTASYKDIAIGIGDVKAVRAVGGANGRNKIAIIIPCHRIIGSSGKLTGYASGLWRKEWLLKHEGILSR